MPKQRKNELVRCAHFAWLLINRAGTWYADGRSNKVKAGRHSLGTDDKAEALRRLPKLDRRRAEDLGLVPRSEKSPPPVTALSLDEGRRLYEVFIKRARIVGGVTPATVKRYRTVFDKFLEFARSKGIATWNQVTAAVLSAYAADLEEKGYASKSQLNELTVLKQAVKWLISAKHLADTEPIVLKLRKVESERAYCWTQDEIRAMVEHCRANSELAWLGNVIVALACTGLRIAEMASSALVRFRSRARDALSNRRKRKDTESSEFPPPTEEWPEPIVSNTSRLDGGAEGDPASRSIRCSMVHGKVASSRTQHGAS